MKRFIAIFPIIIMLIMGNIAALKVRAAGDIETTWTNYVTNKEYTDIDLIKNKSVAFDYLYEYSGSPENYIVFQAVDKYTTNNTDYYCNIGLYLMYSSSTIDLAEDNGVYTITSSDSIYCNYIYNEWYMTSTAITALRQGSFAVNSMFNTGFHDAIYFDANNKTFKYTYNNTEYSVFNSYWGAEPEYILTDFISDGSLDLTVSFTPSLSGEVDRTIEQNGVQAESNYFSMNITNNSDKNAQFLMAIVPTGATTSYCGNTQTDVGVRFSESPIYFLLYKEWVYSPTITGSVASQFKAVETEYYQSSSWHIVSGNSTYTRQFNWQQINIQAGVSYDVVVVAIPTDFNKPSNVFSQSACDHYLDSSTGEEVYRSTFTVPNPATYDSTNTEFGNLSGVPVAELTKADGYIDDNGEAVIEDVSYSDKLADRGTWEPGIIESSVDLFSLEGVQGLFDSCGNVINFIGYSFSFMPSWYWIILLFGITAVVAIGIIKALKG